MWESPSVPVNARDESGSCDRLRFKFLCPITFQTTPFLILFKQRSGSRVGPMIGFEPPVLDVF